MGSISLPGKPLNRANLMVQVESFANAIGPFCGEYEDPNYLAHLNTPNVVRDFDLVRKLSGYETFDFWGFSYGTMIGTMYAHMFPERVGKIVLDGLSQINLLMKA